MNIDDIIESAQLKGRVIALNAQVETLTAEVRCLEAVIRSHERVDCLTVANLKAEVERLESDLKLEKENEDRLVRLWQTANNEVHGQRSQIAALIDNQTSLKSKVERLRKAGIAMGMCLPDTDEANAAYRAFEYAAKEGKQS
jgi:chromosome segregation ATPase